MNSICAFNKYVYLMKCGERMIFCSPTQNYYYFIFFFFPQFVSKKNEQQFQHSQYRNMCIRSVASESHWCAHPFPILSPVPCVCTVFIFTQPIFLFQFNIKFITKLEFIYRAFLFQTPNSVTETRKRISNNWIVHTDKQLKEISGKKNTKWNQQTN